MSESSSTASAATSASRLSVMLSLAVIVLLAHGPMLNLLGQRMWATDHYSFFPLILIGASVIGWQRYREYTNKRLGRIWDPGFRSPLLWLTSIVLLAGSVAVYSPWPAGVGFLLALRASLSSLFDEELVRRLMPGWWFLWLAIPLPLNFDRHLILAMQLLATSLASGVLDLADIRHSLSGVVIQLPSKSFFVEEACSGIQSLFAAVSVTVFYSILGRRGLLRTLILVFFGIIWVLVANATRIVTVTVLSGRHSIPIDQGSAHEATGAVVFVLALILIVSTDRLMLFLAPLKARGAFERRERKSGYRSRTKGRRSISTAWTIPAGVVAVALFGILGVVQWTHAVPPEGRRFVLDREQEVVSETTLPEEWNGWTREAFTIIERTPDDPNGQISRVWRYSRSGQRVSFSLDGPFNSWHDLGLCYKAQGWTVEEEIDHTTEVNEGTRYDYSELIQENGEGRHAYVTFTAFDNTGEQVSPPPFFRVGVGMRFPDASVLLKRIQDRLTPSAEAAEQYSGVVYQTQAFVESQSLLTEAEKKIVSRLFKHLTDTVTQRFEEAGAAGDVVALTTDETD